MNLRSIDLNLLVVLDALLDEAHVSRAASRLGLSQPAASAALDRCRAMFDDPLLERYGSTMRLTTTAESLRGPLREVLSGIGEVLGQRELDFADVRRTVRIVMADVLVALCIPALCDVVGSKAPGIDLVLCQWMGGVSGLEQVERGAADIVVSTFKDATDPGRFHIRDVLEQDYVVAMSEHHPAVAGFDLDKWLAWPHLVISSSADTHAILDEALAGVARSRRVGLSLPSFLLAAEVLRECRMIGMLPAICVAGDLGRGLATFRPPIPIAGFTLKLARHRRHDRDPAIRFVCDELAMALAALGRTQ
jgi:DNA-binding transcriptional LysR family regulator